MSIKCPFDIYMGIWDNWHMEKKIGKYWFALGRKSGFGIGFDIDKYHWSIELGFWYIGQEF